MNPRQSKRHVVQTVTEHVRLAGEDTVADLAGKIGVGKIQAFAVNTVQRGLALLRLTLDVKDRVRVPAGTGQPADIQDSGKLVFPQGDQLDADRQPLPLLL